MFLFVLLVIGKWFYCKCDRPYQSELSNVGTFLICLFRLDSRCTDSSGLPGLWRKLLA